MKDLPELILVLKLRLLKIQDSFYSQKRARCIGHVPAEINKFNNKRLQVQEHARHGSWN